MSSDRYLAHIKIDVMWSSDRIAQINNEDLLQAIISVLKQLEVQIKQQEIQYEGTKEFKPQPLQSIFKPQKEIVVDLSAEPIGYDKDRFVFEQIIWSSEEEDFMALFHKKISTLQQKYDEIYLIRSERAFALYSFDDGQRFEPDFVLFLNNKDKQENVTYQVFIEPKGNQFKDQQWLFWKNSQEWWKQLFLDQINKEAEILDMNFWNYKLIWLPFYNKGLEIEFEHTFDNVFSLAEL